jgi:hypothetical protein
MSPRSVVFNPDASLIEALFAKWVKLYVTQAPLDDAEAESFEQPLIDLEKALEAETGETMQDFQLQLMAGTCFGDGSYTYKCERSDIFAVAMAEVNERESLLIAIEAHRDGYDVCETFSTDDASDTDENETFRLLCVREQELLAAVIKHPATAVSNMIQKGRYLAAVQAVGGLGFEDAEAFVASFGGPSYG